MSPPRAFILLWNSMQPTPSPRSTSEAPEFFLTTPFDFFATATDHTPSETSTGLYVPVRRSKYARPDFAEGSSLYQVLAPDASSFSAFAATGLPSFFRRATVCSTPAMSHNSNGPTSQLKPMRKAASISTTVSAISGMRLPEEAQSSDVLVQENGPAL